MSSKRQAILNELKTRLERVSTDEGFQTNAGALVFVGEVPALGPDDPLQAFAVTVGEAIPTGYQGEHIVHRWPVMIHAIVRVDANDPALMTEAVVADIKRAVERDTNGNKDHSLGGILKPRGIERGRTQAAYRAQGSEFAAGYVEYFFVLLEEWGTP